MESVFYVDVLRCSFDSRGLKLDFFVDSMFIGTIFFSGLVGFVGVGEGVGERFFYFEGFLRLKVFSIDVLF